jgi:two-component system KDP operon response regulator KdpE
MKKTRILVVDDELSIIKFLRANLEARDYEVLTAMDGVEALQTMEMELPDLVILDIMMPKMDGFEVCRRLCEWSQVPIIMLSARGHEEDKVKCLDLGADDYITKPFGASELIARVQAVLRRTDKSGGKASQPVFASGDLKIDFVKRHVAIAGKEIKLTPTEYSLLQEFALNSGKVLTHTHLLNRVWGPDYRDERQYLHVFVRRLRDKLELDPANPQYIETVSGIGYRFQDLP